MLMRFKTSKTGCHHWSFLSRDPMLVECKLDERISC
jgi:hypothetical protein